MIFLPLKNLKYNHKIAWLLFCLSLLVFGLIYAGSIERLIRIWSTSGTYSHGFVSIILVAYLLYVGKNSSVYQHTKPFLSSLILIFLTSLMWFLGNLASVNTLLVFTLPIFLVTIYLLYFGWIVAKQNVIPLTILFFALPVWSVLLPYLQTMTVFSSALLLKVLAIEHVIENNYVKLPQGIFEIEESCSGLRYLLVGVTLSLAYGYLNYQNLKKTTALVISSVLLMIFGNYLRVLVVILLGIWKGMSYPLVQDHANLGWVLFGLLLLPLYYVAKIIERSQSPIFNTKNKTKFCDQNFSKIKYPFIFILFLASISVAPIYANYLSSAITSSGTSSSLEVSAAGEWQGPMSFSSKWIPNYSFYSDSYTAQYTNPDSKKVTLTMHAYKAQQQAKEMININNTLVNSLKWKHIDLELSMPIRGAEFRNMNINKATIMSSDEKSCLRVWYWFDVYGNNLTKKWQVKIHELRAVVLGKTGSALVTISTQCTKDGKIQDEILHNYFENNYAEIKKSLISYYM